MISVETIALRFSLSLIFTSEWAEVVNDKYNIEIFVLYLINPIFCCFTSLIHVTLEANILLLCHFFFFTSYFALHATSHDNFNLIYFINSHTGNNQTKKQYTDSDHVKSDLESIYV